MPSRHLIDPELLPVLDMVPALDLSHAALPQIRAALNASLANREIAIPEGVTLEERSTRAAEGHEIALIVSRPTQLAAAPRPAVLHIHGGGYIIGSAALMNGSNMQLARDADCVVVSVDYRLAPETTHPGPVEDCYAALKWLHESASELGIDPERIAVMGESAGGGLAAALALLARDRNEFRIVHQNLIYPMIDDRTCLQADTHPFTGEFIWTQGANHFGWSALLGHEPGRDGVSPYAAPARAEDLAGLPSTFISVGALDLFLEEDIEYARRLTRAGVPTELHVYPGAFHGFDTAPSARTARQARTTAFAAIYRALYPENQVPNQLL
ncbi:alpha/beta hydrolase [Novosphingobium sp.]|uniref:alpha/beta hydrolase n=1 Tax=Novosphingobium sp. TaxID=1874826 RepID=UPI00261679A4|nr:alpha/beta hydrolase [Novosphingobium sp.]